jgi:hypothetical protein
MFSIKGFQKVVIKEYYFLYDSLVKGVMNGTQNVLHKRFPKSSHKGIID